MSQPPDDWMKRSYRSADEPPNAGASPPPPTSEQSAADSAENSTPQTSTPQRSRHRAQAADWLGTDQQRAQPPAGKPDEARQARSPAPVRPDLSYIAADLAGSGTQRIRSEYVERLPEPPTSQPIPVRDPLIRTPEVSNGPTIAASPENFREPGQPAQQSPSHVAQPPHLDSRIADLGSTQARRKTLFFSRSAPYKYTNPANSSEPIGSIASPVRVGVVGMKGGVGKTTLSVLLAKTAARNRSEPVLLIDGDTTYGSLLLRLGLAPIATSHDIARQGDPGNARILQGAIATTPDGVRVLPSGRDPQESARFTDQVYVATVRAIYRYFPLMFTDCGTGLADPLMSRVITASHALVLATAPSIDGVLATHNALQWLSSIGDQDLAQRSIVVITDVPRTPAINLDEAINQLQPLCESVMLIERDEHLGSGGFIDYDKLAPRTVDVAHALLNRVLRNSQSK